MIIQLILFIPLFARISIAFRRLSRAAHCLIGGTAKGIVFLIGDYLRVLVQFQAGRAKMVAKLIVKQLCGRAITALCTRLDKGEDRKSTRLNSSHQIISYAV